MAKKPKPDNFPRAPTQAEWDAMSPKQRAQVVASLPGEVTDAEMSPPEGDRHFLGKSRALDALKGFFGRKAQPIYLASELPVYYPGERRGTGAGLHHGGPRRRRPQEGREAQLRFYDGDTPLPESAELIARLEGHVAGLQQRVEEEAQRRKEEARRREDAERRLKELQAELKRLRAHPR